MTTPFDPLWFMKIAMPSDMKQWINPAWFSPAFTFNFAGDAGIEKRVVSEVASYGTQIGWLNDIVLALVKGDKPDDATIEKFAKAVKDIDDIKTTERSDALRSAVDALDRLQQLQPDLYDKLVTERKL